MVGQKHFQIGNSVGLINDTLSGVIIRITQNEITFRCEDGFEYTHLKSELILEGNLEEVFIDKNSHVFISEKKALNSSIKKVKKSKISVPEVDLHIHELTNSDKGMSNYDMLHLQLQTAEKNLKNAIAKKQQRIIFIHGIGNGKLRQELHLLLKKYPVTFSEASYTRYGQGATEVYLYQNNNVF